MTKPDIAKTQIDESTPGKRLRLWPGVVIAVLIVLGAYVVPLFAPDAAPFGAIGGVVGVLAIIIWWVFFSRAAWSERLGAVAVMIVAMIITSQIVHKSIATGAMGMLFYILAIPILGIAFVAWAVATRNLSDGLRRATGVATILLACGVWTLVRTGGFTNDFDHDLAWRWSETAEERLLAQAGDELKTLPSEPVEMEIVADWPGFRGPNRDGIIRGVLIESDWTATPPVELWRRSIGPGWSSFAVGGDFFYTQEQRGEDEVVSCYNVAAGEPVWMHRDQARFWESNAGAGPRSTPTLRDGRVYTLGATGIVNVLNAVDGAVVWSRDAASDTDVEVPLWGFASSPLVIDDAVIIAVESALVAYDLASGEPLWFGPDSGGYSYSSPHLMTIDGVKQILLMRGKVATSVAPEDGKMLWEHPLPPGTSIVQPALTANGDLLISDGEGSGIRRIAVSQGAAGWTVEELWTSNRLKPYFSDFVVHNGHAYGFDGSILACIDVEDGKRKWKGGRYGSGQLVLIADQDMLLVLSEKGELALVAATPEQFDELARFPAISGKTWNHPVLVGDVLLVRNAQEIAAFRVFLLGT